VDVTGDRSAGPPDSAGIPDLSTRARTLALVTWLQAGLGAVLRHETQNKNQIGLVLHIVGAMLVIIVGVRLITVVNERLRENPRFHAPAHMIAAALALQIILGLSAWVTTHTPQGYVNPTDIRSLVPTLHLVLGSGILALAVMVGMRASALDCRLKPAARDSATPAVDAR